MNSSEIADHVHKISLSNKVKHQEFILEIEKLQKLPICGQEAKVYLQKVQNCSNLWLLMEAFFLSSFSSSFFNIVVN